MLPTRTRTPAASGARSPTGLCEGLVERTPNRVGIDIGDPKRLLATLVATDELDVRLRDAKRLREQRHARFVRAAALGRYRDAQMQRVAAATSDLGAPGARLKVDSYDDVSSRRVGSRSARDGRGRGFDLEQVLGHLALL